MTPFLYLEQRFRCHQVSAERSGILATLYLLAQVLLILPGMLRKALDVQEQCWESHLF